MSKAAVTEFTIAADSAKLIDPTLAAVTGNAITSIDSLLRDLARAEDYAAKGEVLKAAHVEAIQAFKSGKTEVDESALLDLEPFEATGFANLATDGPMVGVLDSLIAQGVSPAINFAEIITRINEAEEATAHNTRELRTLKRDLRLARPKERIKIDAGPTTATNDVAEMELNELVADLEVEMVLATDVFTGAYGSSSPILGFEVPKFNFLGEHPDVPEVDPNFRFFAPVLAEALHGIVENEIIWLHGESGCGKSEFWGQLAARLGMPFTRVNFDGHLTRSDLLGVNRLLPDPETGNPTMRFVEGTLPRAMARPGILLLDEMDLGDPEIMPILQPVLEGNPLRLLEDGGRVVTPHPMFRIAVTGNTIGLGSENQMYLNAFEQSAATRDRISAFVQMPYLPADIEKEVVMARVPTADEDFVERVVQLANKVREGYRMQEIQQVFSTRSVQYCARRHARFAPLYNDPHEAALAVLESVVLGRMDNASHQAVKGFIDNIFA